MRNPAKSTGQRYGKQRGTRDAHWNAHPETSGEEDENIDPRLPSAPDSNEERHQRQQSKRERGEDNPGGHREVQAHRQNLAHPTTG
eukprot:3522999-Rhodomonas_salina.3